MPSELPFPIPPDSPWFPVVDGRQSFVINGYSDGRLIPTPMDSFGEWPDRMQCLAAAVAAMEWRELSWDSARSHSDCVENMACCSTAFAAARERMNPKKPAPCEHCNDTGRAVVAVDNDHDIETPCEICRERRKGDPT